MPARSQFPPRLSQTYETEKVDEEHTLNVQRGPTLTGGSEGIDKRIEQRLSQAVSQGRPTRYGRRGVNQARTSGVAAAGRSRGGGSRPERERDGHGTPAANPARSHADVREERCSPTGLLLLRPRPLTTRSGCAPRSPSLRAPGNSAVRSVVTSIARAQSWGPALGMAVARRGRDSPRGCRCPPKHAAGFIRTPLV